jgi:hypothetical protein
MPDVTGTDVSRVVGLAGERLWPRTPMPHTIGGLAAGVLVWLVVAGAVGGAPWAFGAEKKKAAAPAAAAAHGKPNACGCYKDAAGACLCGKKGKCGCSGDCEPRGCEEKRAKDMEREIKAETKRAQDAEKRQKSAGKHQHDDGDKAGHTDKPGGQTGGKPGGKKGDRPRE